MIGLPCAMVVASIGTKIQWDTQTSPQHATLVNISIAPPTWQQYGSIEDKVTSYALSIVNGIVRQFQCLLANDEQSQMLSLMTILVLLWSRGRLLEPQHHQLGAILSWAKLVSIDCSWVIHGWIWLVWSTIDNKARQMSRSQDLNAHLNLPIHHPFMLR